MAFGQFDRGNSPQPLSEINVTPLVDVMLVLLVVFIITAPLLTNKIKLDLPKVQATATKLQQPKVLSITKDGSLYLDDAAISEVALKTRLQALAGANPQPTIELRADGELAYRQVAKVMATIQMSGISKIAFTTDPRITGAGP